MSSNHLPSGQAIRKGPGVRYSRSLGKEGGPRLRALRLGKPPEGILGGSCSLTWEEEREGRKEGKES